MRHRKCAVCQYEKHEIWASKCEIRNMQRRRVQHAYELRLRFYSVDNTSSKSQNDVEWTSVTSRRQKSSMTQRIFTFRDFTSKASTLKVLTFVSTTSAISRVQKRVNVNLKTKNNSSQTDDFFMIEKKSAWALTIMNSERRERAFVKSKRDRFSKKLVIADSQANHVLWQRDFLCSYYSTTSEMIA